jgi:hypothetical protein
MRGVGKFLIGLGGGEEGMARGARTEKVVRTLLDSADAAASESWSLLSSCFLLLTRINVA